ncbi:MAG: protein kinase [Planctomycetota bacterium]
MNKIADCPSVEELADFLLGRLPEARREALASHLTICPKCIDRADTVEMNDFLVDTLLTESGLEQMPVQVFDRIKSRMMQIGSTSLTAGTGVLDLAFLEPPKNDGDLGALGKYRIQSVLGHGGMGIVLLATDASLHRQVVLKVMKPSIAQKPEAKQRFQREAQAIAKLKHDNIVIIHHVGEENDVPYIVMERLEGESLAARIQREGALPSAKVMEISHQILDALIASHAEGILHRDIKPDNIWLEKKTDRVKLLDFGLARELDSVSSISQPGSPIGTPAYMSPEQVDGADLGEPSDLFSFGAVLLEMLRGERVFQRNTLSATLVAVSRAEFEPSPGLEDPTGRRLQEIVSKLLQLKPENRPASASQVLEDLRNLQTNASKPSWAQPRLHKLLVASVLGGLVLLFGILILIKSPEGTVEVDVPKELLSTLAVTFTKDGDPVIASQTEGWNVKLQDGNWAVAVAGGGEFVIEPSIVQIKNGNSETVTIRRLPSETTADSTSVAQASAAREMKNLVDDTLRIWLSETQKKSGFARHEAILTELEKRNPDIEYQIERSENPMTLRLTGERLLDLRPLLAASDLKSLHYDELHPKDDSGVLRYLTNLKTINDRSAESYRAVFAPNPNAVPIDNEWQESVARLDDLEQKCRVVEEKLRELNPAFDGELSRRIGASGILELKLDTTYTTDISPLSALDSDHELNLSEPGYTTPRRSWFEDLTPLEGKQYDVVSLTGTCVRDLTPLRGMPLKNLYVRETEIRSFNGMEDAPLRGIDARFCQRLTDLAALSGKSSLVSLELFGAAVQDLGPLAMTSIGKLDLTECSNVADLTPLRNLPLQEINLYATSVTTLEPLRKLRLKKAISLPETVPLIERYKFIDEQKEVTNRDQLLGDFRRQIAAKFADHRAAAELIVGLGGSLKCKTVLPNTGVEVNLNPGTKIPEDIVFRLYSVNLKSVKLKPEDVAVLNKALPDSLHSLDPPEDAASAQVLFSNLTELSKLRELGLNRAFQAKDIPVHKFTNVTALHYSDLADAGCQRIASLKKLERLSLTVPRCSVQSIREMLKALPNLTTIQYAGRGVRDDELVVAIVQAAANLTELSIEETHISDAALEAIGDSKLTRLGITRCRNITDTGIQNLEKLPLDYLRIFDNEQLTDAIYDTVCKIDSLTWLLIGPNVNDNVLARVASLPNLTKLSLEGNQVTNDGLAKLVSTKLKYFVADLPNVNDEGIPNILRLKGIATMNLRNTNVSTKGLRELQPLLQRNGYVSNKTRGLADKIIERGGQIYTDLQPDRRCPTEVPLPKEPFHITELAFDNQALDPTTIVAEVIAASPVISRISLSRMNIASIPNLCDHLKQENKLIHLGLVIENTEDLEAIAELRTLQSIDLTNSSVTCEEIAAYLSELPQLSALVLSNLNPRIADRDLVHLKKLPQLKRITLDDSVVGDQGFEILAKIPLEFIRCERATVTSAGLSHLRNSMSIKALTLNSCDIDDQGLSHLQTIESLQTLWCKDTKVTRKGLIEFQKALPSCRIYCDFGVFNAGMKIPPK